MRGGGVRGCRSKLVQNVQAPRETHPLSLQEKKKTPQPTQQVFAAGAGSGLRTHLGLAGDVRKRRLFSAPKPAEHEPHFYPS